VLGKDHQFIEPAHVMLALLNQEGSSITPLLRQSDVNISNLQTGLKALLMAMPLCLVI